MWSPAARHAAIALACATLVTVATLAAVQAADRLVRWRVAQHRRRRRVVPRETLREFQRAREQPWVALCGTVFDVSGDPFFVASGGGIYASWMHHDVAALLVYGGVIDGRPANESEAELLDSEIAVADVDPASGDVAVRRKQTLDEWYARFHSRYEVIGQMSDLYAASAWETLRDRMTPPPPVDEDGKPLKRRGKCPLGFGSSTVEEEEVDVADEDVETLREIRFQGRRYDVRGSALFESPMGALAHFVGHDITFALATQSSNPADLDVVPMREYTYEEQLRLEHFRRIFAKELRVISSTSAETENGVSTHGVVDLHSLIDQDVEFEEIQKAVASTGSPTSELVNAICPRTTMTPLHKAVEKNRLDLVELLVAAGADVDAPASLYDDETALQMAQRFKYEQIANVLSRHG